MGYAKGLFCVWETDHSYFIWNPSIRKSISLPRPGITKKTGAALLQYLGFGFDPRSNDYKVVRITIPTRPFETVEVALFEIYSLNAGSWKVSTGASNSFPPGCNLCSSQMPFPCLEGAIHWTARAIGNWNEQFVLSFDLSGDRGV